MVENNWQPSPTEAVPREDFETFRAWLNKQYGGLKALWIWAPWNRSRFYEYWISLGRPKPEERASLDYLYTQMEGQGWASLSDEGKEAIMANPNRKPYEEPEGIGWHWDFSAFEVDPKTGVDVPGMGKWRMVSDELDPEGVGYDEMSPYEKELIRLREAELEFEESQAAKERTWKEKDLERTMAEYRRNILAELAGPSDWIKWYQTAAMPARELYRAPEDVRLEEPPPAPAWLPQFAPSQVAGQTITKGRVTTPSGQQWAQTPWSVREGLRGYTEWTGKRPYPEILEHMAMMQPETPAGAGRTRWMPKRQRTSV